MTLYGQGSTWATFGVRRPAGAGQSGATFRKDFFRVFGAAPVLGRTFTPRKTCPDGPAVAVLSYGFWRQRLGADRGILGRAVPLNKQPAHSRRHHAPGLRIRPAGGPLAALAGRPGQHQSGALPGGRRRGSSRASTLSQARADMKVAGERFRAADPKWMDDSESVAVVPMRDSMVEDVRPAAADSAGRGGVRTADRVRQRGQPAAGARGRRARRSWPSAPPSAPAAGAWCGSFSPRACCWPAWAARSGFALGAWGVRALLLVAPGNIPRLTDAGSAQAVAAACSTGAWPASPPALRAAHGGFSSACSRRCTLPIPTWRRR